MYTLYQSESKKKLLANINKRENYLSQSLTEHTKTKTRLVLNQVLYKYNLPIPLDLLVNY